jgi:tRNA U34 5-methylaminomethyl-2-thiouridine-forming methyltransferase MnmC
MIRDMELKNYDFIKTDDGSITVFSKKYNEMCHSSTGASAETQVHYIAGCQVKEKLKNSPIKVFEVGFGIGIGFFETLQASKSLKENHFTFVSIEIDEELVLYTLKTNKLFESFVKRDYYYIVETVEFTLYILIGDGRNTFPKFQNEFNFSYDCIYQDAFSPKRNSILWTKEWFAQLYKASAPGCIMSTYSASSSIRKSMIAGGWALYDGVRFGNKRASTRATNSGDTPDDILKHLEKSPVIMITDDNYIKYTME